MSWLLAITWARNKYEGFFGCKPKALLDELFHVTCNLLLVRFSVDAPSDSLHANLSALVLALMNQSSNMVLCKASALRCCTLQLDASGAKIDPRSSTNASMPPIAGPWTRGSTWLVLLILI